MKRSRSRQVFVAAILSTVSLFTAAFAQVTKPNVVFILADNVGYGDLGPYGGGENRGIPTPSLDRLAAESMQFWPFYALPSCTPGRAARSRSV